MVLRAPYQASHTPGDITRIRIAGYISAVINKPRNQIRDRLPMVMARWGRMRIADEGDRIRSVSASTSAAETDETERDMSFVRVRLH